MKRPRRIIFGGLTVLSLVLCVATTGLWVRSYSLEDSIVWQRPTAFRMVRSSSGYLIINLEIANWSGGSVGVRYRKQPHDPLAVQSAHNSVYILNYGPGDRLVSWKWADFTWMQWRGARGNSIGTAVVPLWPILGASVLLPTWWQFARTRRRLVPGRCEKCGYDLRATPDRCPECGTLPRRAME